jgi:hypothetical protein
LFTQSCKINGVCVAVDVILLTFELSTTTNTNNQSMKNLIKILRTETQTLETQYIALMREWAIEEFDRIKDLTYTNLKEMHGVWTKGHRKDAPSFWMTTRKVESEYSRISNIQYNGLGAFLEKTEANAKFKYDQSIEKLAARIEKKELNQSTLTVVTSHVGVNIETTLTDGEKTVRAFTIIASGPVQKPHYRYLVK